MAMGGDFDTLVALAMEKGSLILIGQKAGLAQSRFVTSGAVKTSLTLAGNRTPVFSLQVPSFISMPIGYK
jgi:hypothetical protein